MANKSLTASITKTYLTEMEIKSLHSLLKVISPPQPQVK